MLLDGRPGTVLAHRLTRAPIPGTIGKGVVMSDWGLCKDCKWWQIEPDSAGRGEDLGLCIDEDLQPFLLRINGDGGCNHFMPGEPARAKGSSAAPPTAKPVR